MKLLLSFARRTGTFGALALSPLLPLAPAGSSAAESTPQEAPHYGKLPPVDQAASSHRLTLKDFRSFVEGHRGLILDARAERDYKQGHVPGALSLPLEGFESHYAPLKAKLEAKKTQPIAVYCSSFSCEASELLQKKLMNLGFTQIFVFPNGWAAWKLAELPEESGEGPAAAY